jgi:hypothetical protein
MCIISNDMLVFFSFQILLKHIINFIFGFNVPLLLYYFSILQQYQKVAK